jgi:hypothetical protein
MKDRSPSRWGRAIAVLAVVALGVMTVAPAFSAHNNKHVRKISSKVANNVLKNKIDNLGNPIFIEEAELVRFGPINLSAGQSAPIGTFGPFTLTADCAEGDFFADGAPFEYRGRILISTSEDNSAFVSNDDSEDDFDAADAPEDWAENTAEVGTQDINSENDESAHALSPSGTWISSAGNIIALTFDGAHCQFAGAVLTS